jgi:hypothetical protein
MTFPHLPLLIVALAVKPSVDKAVLDKAVLDKGVVDKVVVDKVVVDKVVVDKVLPSGQSDRVERRLWQVGRRQRRRIVPSFYCRSSTAVRLLPFVYCRSSTAVRLLPLAIYRTSTTDGSKGCCCCCCCGCCSFALLPSFTRMLPLPGYNNDLGFVLIWECET